MNKIKYIFFSTIIILLLAFVYFVTYSSIEPKAYDFMIKNSLIKRLPFDNTKNVYGHDDIVLVIIDKKTVEKKRWPWNRDVNCQIFDYFYEYAKPKVVVHDAILSSLDKDNPESDKKYFESIGRFDNFVVGFMPLLRQWENSDFGKNYENKFYKKFKINVENNATKSSYLYSSMIPFPDEYFDATKYTGSITMIPGAINGNLTFGFDEIFRNHDYLILYKDFIFPSLAMRTFMLAHNNPKVVVNNKFIEFPDLKYKFPYTKTDYQLIVPLKYYKLHSNGYSHKMYSAIDIMDSYNNISQGKKPIINPEVFKDKIVVIGANVPAGTGLNDNKNSPIAVNHPGVDYQATAIDNIMHNDFLKILPDWLNVLITLAGMVLIYLIIKNYALLNAIFLTILTIFTYICIVWVCYYYSVVINVITPVVMSIFATIISYIHKFIIENKNKQKVENALGKYMSQDVMKNVIKNIDNLGLGGKKAFVTVLFSDIRGFTSMSEKMSAEEVTSMLNEYFSEMEPIVSKYNGIINKYIGDAIMAVFGEPIQDINHAQNAVKCGLEMLTKVKELNKNRIKENKPAIKIGIGINTGEVFIGNIGSERRMEYTVIGDTVNLASRLESYNKVYNTHMLISSSTYEASKEIVNANLISDVEVRGKAEKLNIYEIVSMIK